MYEGNTASAIGTRQTSNPASIARDARPTTAVEMALNHNAQVANEIRECALELRNRLVSVLPSHAHQDPPLSNAPPNNKVEMPPVPLVQAIEEITATQHRTLDVLRTIQQHLAL